MKIGMITCPGMAAIAVCLNSIAPGGTICPVLNVQPVRSVLALCSRGSGSSGERCGPVRGRFQPGQLVPGLSAESPQLARFQ